MRENKVCLNCGSSSIVSDRSLGGKMVCFKCGSSSFSKKLGISINKKKIIFTLIGILVFLLIIA